MLKPRARLTKKQIKEDKLVTFYFQSTEFLKHNQKYIIGGIAAVVILILLSIFVINTRKEDEKKASRILAVARFELANMNTKVAIDTLEMLVKEYDGTSSAGVGCFYLANTYFMQQNFESARKYYEEYLDDYKDEDVLSSSSLAGVAACMEQNKDYKNAAEFYEKSSKKYPDVFDVAEKWMSAARCYRLAGIKENAMKIYKLIIEKFPNSGYKNEAEIYLAQLEA